MATHGSKTQTEQLLDTLDTLAAKFERRLDAQDKCPLCGKPKGEPFHANHAAHKKEQTK